MEWTGLLLLVALALGAAVAYLPRVEGRGLGAVVAQRIGCAAGGECVHAAAEARPAAASAGQAARASPRTAAAGLTGARRFAGVVARRAWIACLGYRRFRYERSHPGRLSPLDPIPLEEGLATANACLNPLGFLGDD